MVSVTVTEPRFSVVEKALLIASRRAANVMRGRHGLPIADSTDPSSVGKWVVDPPVQDFAQAALNKAQKAYQDKYGEHIDMDSLYFRVRRA